MHGMCVDVGESNIVRLCASVGKGHSADSDRRRCMQLAGRPDSSGSITARLVACRGGLCRSRRTHIAFVGKQCLDVRSQGPRTRKHTWCSHPLLLTPVRCPLRWCRQLLQAWEHGQRSLLQCKNRTPRILCAGMRYPDSQRQEQRTTRHTHCSLPTATHQQEK